MLRSLISIILVGCVLYYLYLTNPERGAVQEVAVQDFLTEPEGSEPAVTIPVEDSQKTVQVTQQEQRDKTHSRETVRVESAYDNTAGDDQADNAAPGEVMARADMPQEVTEVEKTSAVSKEVATSPKEESASTGQASINQGELVLGNGEGKGSASIVATLAEQTPTPSPLTFKDALPSQLASNGAEVFFAFDSYELSDSGKEVLRKIAERTKDKNSLILEIAGLTDGIGESSVNEAFAKARSQAVLTELQKFGFPRERIRVTSKSPSSSLAATPNQSAAAKRRVTVAITDGGSPKAQGAS